MLRKLLICGLVAGACGGVLAAGVARLVGEGPIDRAVGYERARAPVAAGPAAAARPMLLSTGHHDDPAPVSRSLQKSAGLLTAAIVYGLALGGIFALVFALAYGRVARAAPRTTAWTLAGAAWVVFYLVPFLKYPASPPGASDPSTIGRRTGLYATMIAISVLAAVAAARLGPVVRRRGLGAGSAAVAAAGLYVAVVIGGGLALPSVNEVPRDFPATTLWRFREASVGMQATLWATIGLVFAPAGARAMAGQALWPWRTWIGRLARADSR